MLADNSCSKYKKLLLDIITNNPKDQNNILIIKNFDNINRNLTDIFAYKYVTLRLKTCQIVA